MNLDHQLRVRFHEAGAEKDAIVAKTVDLHAEAQALAEKAHALLAQRETIIENIRAIEAPAVELQREMAKICAVLDHKTALPEHEG